MLRFFRTFFLTLAACVGLQSAALATHVVGADLTYTCNNGVYTVRLDLFQDCLTGDPGAIADDIPAIFAVYTGGVGPQLVDFDTSVQAAAVITVPANFNNACVTNPPPTCLKRTTFITQFSLPPRPDGYVIVYQRCCRNGSVVNIRQPGETGASYFVRIPGSGSRPCNQSAVFTNYPPQIVCINNPLVYDHSATDADGDSLSYEFCEAYAGGAPSNPKPFPPPPPYSVVDYNSPYSEANPMAGFPQVQIDAATGLISGTPNVVGRFVVTVCCHEWRNGVIINTTKREFQFVVTNCSKSVVANIPQYSTEFNTYIVQCDGFQVRFVNQSTGGFAYDWDFGVPGSTTDVSTDFEPTFTYPDTGTYVVKLVVNRGSTCPDSITRFVKVYPTLRTDFEFAGLPCPNTPIQFTDRTFSTFGPVTSYAWNFGDGATAGEPNPAHAYAGGGSYPVSLITRNNKGCIDTAVKTVEIENFRPYAGEDTVIVRGESIRFRASGGQVYTWTPATNLSDTRGPNPLGFYPEVGTFPYNVNIVSAGGCVGDDSIYVRVVNQASLFVPTAFSPNGDGRNDLLRPLAIGYRRINYFRVFNRFGQRVFSSSAFEGSYFGEGWDGKLGGRPAEMGVYYWVASVTDRFGKEEMIKGDVTLLY